MREFLRYTFASGIALIMDMGGLYLFTEWLEIYYLLSATLSFTIGASVAYFLSIKWAFSHRSIEKAHHEFIIFVVIGVLGLCINIVLMWLLTELSGLHYMYSKLSATLFVFLFNYVARRKLLFTPKLANEVEG